MLCEINPCLDRWAADCSLLKLKRLFLESCWRQLCPLPRQWCGNAAQSTVWAVQDHSTSFHFKGANRSGEEGQTCLGPKIKTALKSRKKKKTNINLKACSSLTRQFSSLTMLVALELPLKSTVKTKSMGNKVSWVKKKNKYVESLFRSLLQKKRKVRKVNVKEAVYWFLKILLMNFLWINFEFILCAVELSLTLSF